MWGGVYVSKGPTPTPAIITHRTMAAVKKKKKKCVLA